MMKHITDRTQELVLNSTDQERIKAIKTFKWIGYTKAKLLLDKMNDFIHYPTNHRMPNILLVGDSNNGKTALLHRFQKMNEAFYDEELMKAQCPVLIVQAPPEPDERRFYNAILTKVFAPTKTSERIDSRQNRVMHILKNLGVKVLVIDEIHHVLAGTPTKQRVFLNVLKYISNELSIPLVIAGTKLAFNAIQSDQQLSNRFEPNILNRWSNDNEYKRLLLSFERILPLKKESGLIKDSISNKILSMSDGLIGEVSKIIELSAIEAINKGTERITIDILDHINFIPPTKRKKAYFNNGLY